jgi:hypothetical protein
MTNYSGPGDRAPDALTKVGLGPVVAGAHRTCSRAIADGALSAHLARGLRWIDEHRGPRAQILYQLLDRSHLRLIAGRLDRSAMPSKMSSSLISSSTICTAIPSSDVVWHEGFDALADQRDNPRGSVRLIVATDGFDFGSPRQRAHDAIEL